ncbi:MAG: hypothetical protein SFX73_13405 [Kofleriaceae bacterium]|nr:hypothetical protein [Kofleriaceae bacterium]
MSTPPSPTAAPRAPDLLEQELAGWRTLEQQLGVAGPGEVLDMIRSLEAQLLALYGDLDEGAAR